MILQGQDLMVFIGTGSTTTSIGYATNHTLNINLAMTETSHKDVQHGDFVAQTAQKLSWDASSDNFMSDDQAGYGYNEMVKMMITKEPVQLVFSLKTGTSTPTTGWTPQSTGSLKGQAYISSISLNAPDQDNATFTVSFTGNGSLEPIEA